MKKRLFIYTTLIVIAGLLGLFAAALFSVHANNLRIAEDTVIETAQICAGLYNDGAVLSSLADMPSSTRITIIASDGRVLADTRRYNMDAADSHIDRPEIIAAASGEPEAHTRYSTTLGINMIYYALKVDLTDSDDYVFIRAATPVTRVDAYLTRTLPFLVLILLVIIVLCFILSRVMINRITRPLESVRLSLSRLTEGRYSNTPLTVHFEEIDDILREIDDIALILQDGMKALQDEKSKAEYILNNIGDGIFAVSDSRDIVLINNAAQSIFDVTPDIIGKSIQYLTYNDELLNAIDECINFERNLLTELSTDGKTYMLNVKRPENTDLTMVILSDITDSRESAKRREDFFDNASHELKTPLTAIKGFAELCAINNKDENINKYIDGITRETERMLLLISDMLKLSELSATRETEPVAVSLCEVASEVQKTLSGDIEQKALSFEIKGNLVVTAEQEHIYELLKNLIENAVRYNTDRGKISVVFGRDRMTVSDTGIGIPRHAQARLFERFYRVEKSRSIRSGGTGLGLAIVKHICALYGWGLSLRSRPGTGTDVTVVFKR